MKNSSHPDFLRVAIFVAAGSFAGAGALFLVLLVFTGRAPDRPLSDILPNSAVTDQPRDLIRQTETLRNLVRSYDQQLESDRRLIERQQTLIARLENAQQKNAQPEGKSAPPIAPLPPPATELTPVEDASLPQVSAAPPPAPEAAEVANAAAPEIAPPENPEAIPVTIEGEKNPEGEGNEEVVTAIQVATVGENPPTEALRSAWPRGLFDVVIRAGGAALRIEPAISDEEPLRVLQAGETFTVTRVLSLEDGVWYELRHGWIKHSSRIEQIEPKVNESAANLLLPSQFSIQIHHGVNLYPVPSSKSIWNLKLLADGERHIVTSERQQEDGTWYELRYGWVKKTERVAELGKK